jgi:hypothetical protein
MTEFLLETLNGDWGLAAVSLAIICAMYLVHEGIAYRVFMPGGRDRLTRQMRVMSGVFTLSVGVAIRSLETMRWRMGGGESQDLSKTWLLIGGVLALVGFLCTIREISQPLYGNKPWLLTLAAMAVYTAANVWWWLLG